MYCALPFQLQCSQVNKATFVRVDYAGDLEEAINRQIECVMICTAPEMETWQEFCDSGDSCRPGGIYCHLLPGRVSCYIDISAPVALGLKGLRSGCTAIPYNLGERAQRRA